MTPERCTFTILPSTGVTPSVLLQTKALPAFPAGSRSMYITPSSACLPVSLTHSVSCSRTNSTLSGSFPFSSKAMVHVLPLISADAADTAANTAARTAAVLRLNIFLRKVSFIF